jgi:Zn-dependent metalloprotease
MVRLPERRLRGTRGAAPPEAAATGAATAVDAESAAREYAGAQAASELALIDIQDWPAAGLRTVKFRQRRQGVDIYGTLIAVQLDAANRPLGLTGEFAPPPPIPPMPGQSETACLKRAAAAAGRRGAKPGRTRLNYYYDGNRWRLAYIFEDIRRGPKARRSTPHVADYVIDANTGALIDTLPRVKHATDETIDTPAGKVRVLRGDDGALTLEDREFHVRTFDFGFKDIIRRSSRLPGAAITNPPDWNLAALRTHANASRAARFLKETLGRNSYDDQGTPIILSLNCTYSAETTGRNWPNAFWDPSLKQVLFGQQEAGGELLSFGMALDIVAHEIFHGVTDTTARLEYLAMPGALSESYADIFGVLLNNFDNSDRDSWNWEIAEEVGSEPKRDLSNPARTGDPATMADYRDLPLTKDHGGIHSNSAIHNRVFHAIATAKRPGGAPWFDSRTLALIFYHAMVAHLSRTSTFVDSRNAVLLVAAVVLRDDADQDAKLGVIRHAFDDAGIA